MTALDLIYDPKSPLLFNSSLFLGLFLAFYLVYVFTYKYNRFRTVYVLLFSFFFYYKAGGMYFILLATASVFNYFLSKLLYETENPGKRKIFIVLLVVINLGILAYYKYTNFIIGNINAVFNGDISFQNIILPIGISFFIFQAISYSIDVYRREIEPARNLLDFSFYLCFFPQLVAGPIVRAKAFLPQMYEKIKLSKEDMGKAFFLIMAGLIKKAVISDYISLNFVDRIFDAPNSYTAIENLLAAYGYAIQIYCDFSGYSDMAIGLALLMGFKLPINFLTPYKSKSVTEFWKRWHISLSSWLRDYLYISLGGNRKGNVRTYVNLFLTMLIGGLWHGAAWRFVVWGGLHGIALAIERILKPYIKIPQNAFTRIIGVILTFHFVMFAWIFFRAQDFSTAMELIGKIGQLSFKAEYWLSVITVYKNVLIVLLAGFIMHFLPDRFAQWSQKIFIAMPIPAKAIIIGLVLWLVYATASSEVQPFIYFQF
ncbi:MAG: MBOAT family protein [Candidatus Fibromonas sp.]|jgi:D-alanyl-lipoteichoic acid acyltransferase DltB (MBOAT superfamily)|nr:MBOAT family protein [Candidatus Fibromonas sp.]